MTFTAEGLQAAVQRDATIWVDIASCLNEAEEAKQLLRRAGYGVTGQGILETVKEFVKLP